jgi:hypothetical protein
VTDPIRREALRKRADRLRNRLAAGVGVLVTLVFAVASWIDLGRGPARRNEWVNVVVWAGAALVLARVALFPGSTADDGDLPFPEEAERIAERRPSRAEWTMTVLRSLGYGGILHVAIKEIVEKGLGVHLHALELSSPSILDAPQLVQVTVTAVIATAHVAYYLAPRAPEDRRARVFGEPEPLARVEAFGVAILSPIALGMLFHL